MSEQPGISITRVFEAPRERVWQEWTEPERFADWFGGTQSDVPLWSVSMDVRPGGSWRLTMFAEPGRREIQWEGEYREVAPPERLVFTVTDEPGEDARELVIVVLTDLGDGRTRLVATSLVDSFEGRDAFVASGMEVGVREGYERLDELLAR